LQPALVKLERQEIPVSTRIETVKTRPENMIDKKGNINAVEVKKLQLKYLLFLGNSGQEISLVTNFFAMTSRPDFTIYHYHVTFSPEIDSRGRRGFLLRAHKNILQGYVFDGLHLFSSVQYHPEVEYFCFKKAT